MRTNLFASLTAPLVLLISSLHMLAYGVNDIILDDLKTTNHIVSLFCSEPDQYKIRNIGDINGDGIEDLAISNWDYQLSAQIYIAFGRKKSASSIDLDNLLASGQGFLIFYHGSDMTGYLGSALSPAGDINNDGVNDFIVGGLCEAYVFFGRKEGFTNINISTITQAQGFRIYSPSCNNYAFAAVSNAGDFNNDGIDDIMIGITVESPLNRLRAGSVYILFGHHGPFLDVNLTEFRSGAQGLKIIGAKAQDCLGGSVSSIGDFNNDGRDDVILALTLDYGFVDLNTKEMVYVIYGHEGAFQDLDLATLTKGQGFQIINENNKFPQEGNYKYWLPANAGDFNGDGINDLAFAVTSPMSDLQSNSSLIYVVFGVSGGLSDSNLSDVSGNRGFQVNPPNYNDMIFLANSADVNGDGMSDLIFGLFGFFHVIYGRNDRVSQVDLYNLTSADGFRFRINNTEYYAIGYSGDSIDFNNDGVMDLAIGVTSEPSVSVILNPHPKSSKTNVTAIVLGTVIPCVVVIACVLIYVKRRKGLKQKAAANKKKIEYISQLSNQEEPVAGSLTASPTAKSRENVPMLSKAKVHPKDQENAAAPEVFIELAPKRIHPENTSIPMENKEEEEEEHQSIKDLALVLGQNIENSKQGDREKEEEENQSIKDLALVLGQNIENSKQGEGEQEDQNQQALNLSVLLARDNDVQDEEMPQQVPAKLK